MLLPIFLELTSLERGVSPKPGAPTAVPASPKLCQAQRGQFTSSYSGKLLVTVPALCGNLVYQQAQKRRRWKAPAEPGDELLVTLWTLASAIQANQTPEFPFTCAKGMCPAHTPSLPWLCSSSAHLCLGPPGHCPTCLHTAWGS